MTILDILALGENCGWKESAGEAASSCPPEFFQDNEWSRSAARIYGNADCASWKWKALDDASRRRGYAAVLSMLSSFWLDREIKLAIAGWMLKELLHSPP